jgi:hypothetical protein
LGIQGFGAQAGLPLAFAGLTMGPEQEKWKTVEI